MLNMNNFAIDNTNIMDIISTTYQDILDFAISEDFDAEKNAIAEMMADRIRHSKRYINGKKDITFKTRDAKTADIIKKHHDKSARAQEKSQSLRGDIWYRNNIIPLKGGSVMLGKDIVETLDKDLWHPRRKADRKVNLMDSDENFNVTDSAMEKDPLYEEFLNWKAKHEVEELKAENAELKATVEFLSNQYNSIRKELLAIKRE